MKKALESINEFVDTMRSAHSMKSSVMCQRLIMVKVCPSIEERDIIFLFFPDILVDWSKSCTLPRVSCIFHMNYASRKFMLGENL